MGMSLDRSLKLRGQMKTRLLDIISSCVCFHATHAHIIERVNNEVFAALATRKAPSHVSSYLRGVYDTKMDDLYKYHLVWCMWVDGALHTSEEMRAMDKAERASGADKDPNYISPWGRCDSDKSNHVWKDSKGNVLKDKPYSVKAA